MRRAAVRKAKFATFACRRLDISSQFWQIEQYAHVPVLLQYLPQRDQALRIARQG